MSNKNNDAVYYFSENGVVNGPYTLNELLPKISVETLVFVEDGIKWLKAEEIPEIMNAINLNKQSPELENENDIKAEANLIQQADRSDSSEVHKPANDCQNQSFPKEQPQELKTKETDHYSPPINLSQSKSSTGAITIVSILLLVFTGLALFYFFWLAPFLKDKNAPRKYCYISSLMVRSSKVMGVDYNVIGTYYYGDEIIAYEDDGTWTTCKYNDTECFVASRYLLGKEDFHLLHSIFSDADSRDAVSTAKCRIALLEYYKRNNLMGAIDEATQIEIFGKSLNYPIWELKTRKNDIKPNTVIYPRVVNANSKFADFGCLIKNLTTGKRKFLLFSFADDETPTLEEEQDAPDTGYISGVNKYYAADGSYYYINYSY